MANRVVADSGDGRMIRNEYLRKISKIEKVREKLIKELRIIHGFDGYFSSEMLDIAWWGDGKSRALAMKIARRLGGYTDKWVPEFKDRDMFILWLLECYSMGLLSKKLGRDLEEILEEV